MDLAFWYHPSLMRGFKRLRRYIFQRLVGADSMIKRIHRSFESDGL